MELHIFSPYIIGLSSELIARMHIRWGDNICFAVTKKDGNIKGVWMGVETIFTSSMAMSYTVKKNHFRGMDGFSAKNLIYEVNFNPGVYNVSPEPIYSRVTGIDWYEIQILSFHKRNWRLLHSCNNSKKNPLKYLENDFENDTFV